jgi:membrane associated rhomboid family serine protease
MNSSFPYPITIALIVANCIISFLAFNNNDLMNKLIFHPVTVSQQKQWYRFISSGFLHKDFNHLLFNMITLFFFGGSLEVLFKNYNIAGGAIGYLFFYIAAIIVADLPTYKKEKNNANYYSLGASGAVCAVLFATVLFDPWATLLIKFIIPVPFIVYAVGYLIYSNYMSKKGGDGIGHSAHLWGGLFGIAFMLFAYPHSLQIFLEKVMHPHFLGF